MNNQLISDYLRAGINKNTIAILRRLNRRYTVASLARELKLSHQITYGLLRKLINRGLVERNISEKHRRGERGNFPYVYTLSDKGITYINWVKGFPL